MKPIETVQQFSGNGRLTRNANLQLAELRARVGSDQHSAYSYIVRSVKLDHESLRFRQHGSAPNFQGGVLTLCTCKHQMRSSRLASEWPNVWIAGFTSRTICDGGHWLFYLARVEAAHESHSDLWNSMPPDVRNTKAAHLHFLGDMFEPKSPAPAGAARYSPNRYVMPQVHAHRPYPGAAGWKNDISYRYAARFGHPPLLVADPRKTFLWAEPMILFPQHHCRNYFKWSSLQDLVRGLREAG